MLELINIKCDLIQPNSKTNTKTLNKKAVDVKINFKIKNDWDVSNFDKYISNFNNQIKINIKMFLFENAKSDKKFNIIQHHVDLLKTDCFTFNYQIYITFYPKQTLKSAV